ncbi:MAG: hypothetical protein PHU85_10930 [Phycisphaerae bacterium]|nr:hypothetical protein [Phycisphaerae bacterium]
MSSCDCQEYPDLTLERTAISGRARKTKHLKGHLVQIADGPDEGDGLFRCPICQQLWQRNFAWNWGNKEYLFRVPETSLEDWIKEPFVAPDAVLIYVAVIDDFISKQKFALAGENCRRQPCGHLRISSSAFCLRHHIESLQRNRMLPQTPPGRWWGPYLKLAPNQLWEYVASEQSRLES